MKEYIVTINVRLNTSDRTSIVDSVMDELELDEQITDLEAHLVRLNSLRQYEYEITFNLLSHIHPNTWVFDIVNEQLEDGEEVEVDVRLADQTL